ncbi:MAG: maleylpyruvate isomerase [Microbacterium sp.]|jgi:maleylpyruvate isomerase|nr:maleylpyruvate isomerase [Microbacterium sp.]
MPARTDNVRDPELVAALLMMRRGQAYWARKLNELHDDEFDGPSRVPGWTRRQLIAHVGFHARALARLVEWARTGVERRMYDSPEQRAEEIDFGATLPTEALRNLCAHAAVHLNVEWRDLPEASWRSEVRTAGGRLVPATETVWMRTREVWIHAVDLDNGGRVTDFPPELVDALLEDLVRVWRWKIRVGDRDVILEPVDRAQRHRVQIEGDRGDPLIVRGTAADLVTWGTGRGDKNVSTPEGDRPPPAPGWP